MQVKAVKRLSRSALSILVGIALGIICIGLIGSGLLALAGGRALGLLPTPAATSPVLFGPTTVAMGEAPIPGPTVTPFQAAADCSRQDRINILILGIDGRESNYDEAARTDTLMVAGINYGDRTASLLSFPRDLYVALPGLEPYAITEGRINTAYVYGEAFDLPGGGPGLVQDTVTVNFGIRLHRHVVLSFQAFVDTVNALGGIDLDVPEAIYDDEFPADVGDGTILFELPAGQQHLDGITALRYARTRHQDNDFNRIKRQQQVLLAIRDKALGPDLLPRLPALVEALYGSVRTDLSLTEMASLLCIGQKIGREAIRTYALDSNYVRAWVTEEGAQVIIPDREAIAPIVEEFNGGS